MNYLASAASAAINVTKSLSERESLFDNLKGRPEPHLVQNYSSTSLLSHRVTWTMSLRPGRKQREVASYGVKQTALICAREWGGQCY